MAATEPPPALLDREALRQAALARAARQGAPVARRRLFWRTAAWRLQRALRWLLPLALLAAAAVVALRHGG